MLIRLPGFVLIFILLAPVFAQAASTDSIHVNVMSFNIRYNNPNDGVHAWPNRKDRVVALLKFYEADVIGMQEVLKEQVDDLASMLPGFAWVGVGRDDGDSAGEFSPIFYNQEKFSVANTGTFWLSETPELVGSRGWDAALPRIATWALLNEKSTNREFLVLNSHFDHRGEVARIESAKLIAKTLPSLADAVPWIVTGDFNKGPGSEVYRALRTVLLDSKVESVAAPYGPEGTFGGFTVEAGETSDRIDYVFLSNGITVHRYAAISDHWNGNYPSDHLPVFARIEF